MPIVLNSVTHIYNKNTDLEFKGLYNISFEIPNNSFTAIVGHTGSGKSTLLQHLNGLLKPTDGTVKIDDYSIDAKTSNKDLNSLRKKVGMVFQFPESQLFAESVLKDVMFGPLNFGYSAQEAEKLSKKWLDNVGISKKLYNNSVFDLSGGQMRRVAIAGVLASEPKYLCLDEPSAGLDPKGQQETMKLFKNYQNEGGTVILVTHNMDEVINYADSTIVLENGKVIRKAEPTLLFSDSGWLAEHQLIQPSLFRFATMLNDKDFEVSKTPKNISSIADQIIIENKKRETNE